MTPMITFTTILSLINSFKVFREVYMLTGDYPVSGLYMLQHYMNNTFASADYQKLSTAAIYMCFIMIIVMAILFAIEHHFGKDLEEE
jgi:multiple sugar transport system permease protein